MSESSNAVPGQAGVSPAALPDPAAAALAQNQAAVGTTQVPDAQAQGFSHFISQSDLIGKSLFVVLLVMSLASWYLIVVKSIANMRTKHRSKQFLDKFWQSTSLDAVANEINTHGANDPFSHLASHAMHARDHHARFGAAKLEEAGTQSDFVMRTMRKVIDEETAKLESGLTVLASVGSTAPFVGLFGTVWGVYHALVAIGMGGGATIDRIAGPVGEALIMTGLGLAVAIPAVLAFNAFVRRNRVLLAQLDAFAHDLFAFLTTGQQIDNEGRMRAIR
jgi:biopolymer transport protein ExbB